MRSSQLDSNANKESLLIVKRSISVSCIYSVQRAGFTQLIDLLRWITQQLRQYGIRVSASDGCWRRNRAGLTAKRPRNSHMRSLSDLGMLEPHKVSAFAQMLVGREILVTHRRKGGNAGTLQSFGDLPSIASPGPFADNTIEFILVLLARRQHRESWILSQFRGTHYRTQGKPLSFVSHRDTHPFVRVASGLVGIMRRHRRMVITDAFGLFSGDLVLKQTFRDQLNGRFK